MAVPKIEIYAPKEKWNIGLKYVFNYKDMSCGIFAGVGFIQLVIYGSYYSNLSLRKLGWKRTMAMNDLRKLKCFLRDVDNIQDYRKKNR